MIKAAFTIAFFISLFWTFVGYHFGLRNGWLWAIGIGTFVVALFSITTSQSGHSGRD